jgi:large subunit ribosomal protein L10
MAALPSREVLLAMVVGGIKAPITGFVFVLSGIIRKFVYVVDAVKASKEKAAPQTQATQ